MRLGGSSHLLFQLPPTTQHSLQLVKHDHFDDFDAADDDNDDDDADDDDDDMMMISFLQANTHCWYLNMTIVSRDRLSKCLDSQISLFMSHCLKLEIEKCEISILI